MKKMLIDATSQSEIRLAVINDNQLENYELERRPSKYNKGNVYLAKVIRVEPSLQAAFVEYDDNTQGFLPFSEIHPDYFRIPVEDYEALMAEQREARRLAEKRAEEQEGQDEDGQDEDTTGDGGDENADESDVADADETANDEGGDDSGMADLDDEGGRPIFTPKIMRRYKIQEVIKHGQLMLVQVTKEERGNKRAALSTYIALAGCYCVLIPNALFSGGVSRKIPSGKERKRLKKVLSAVNVPDGMALILRTAAEGKTKAVIGRELKYLQNFWNDMRQRTLDSVAPLLIHTEGDLINRSLRDIYSKQIDEVYIAGEDAFKQAKDFTKNLNPKLSRTIQKFTDQKKSLFESFGLETDLQNLLLSEVVMPSGGALVIEQTEALVSIDINSGKAIGERNLEETALSINLEAANEIARQLRLRDLAGLIVIDFIDMERRGNQQKVERTLKGALKNDKARVRVGRISAFGLLEMSRQRLGPSLIERVSDVCPKCHGLGRVMGEDGMATALMRTLRQHISDHTRVNHDATAKDEKVTVRCLPKVAECLLNKYLGEIRALEEQSGLKVIFVLDGLLDEVRGWKIDVKEAGVRERGGKRRERKPRNSDKRRHDNRGQETGRESGGAEKSSKSDEEDGDRRKRSRSRGRRKAPLATEETANENTLSDQDSEAGDSEGSSESMDKVAEKTEAQEKPKRARSRKTPAKKSAESPQDAKESPADSTEETKKSAPDEASQPEAVAVESPEAPSDQGANATAKVRGKPMPEAISKIAPKRKGWWNMLS